MTGKQKLVYFDLLCGERDEDNYVAHKIKAANMPKYFYVAIPLIQPVKVPDYGT